MINNESLKRSEILTDIAQDFFEYKLNYVEQRKQRNNREIKEKILNFFDATETLWNDWHWQINHQINKIEQLNELFDIFIEKQQEIQCVERKYRWAITPHYLSLLNDFNEFDPIYLQAIPQVLELNSKWEEDPMNEINNNPAGAITRRYPDRITINLTNKCASFCRHCQRKRNIGESDYCVDNNILKDSLDYISKHPEIRDVLLTGGDPLTLSNQYIESVLNEIRKIKSVEIIRIGSRTLVTLPQRIDETLLKILKKYEPIYINTQFNHPNEICNESITACNKLADNGVVLGNQSVFLKGVNNNYYILALLNELLLKNRIRPYYIFHPKNVKGTNHFYISIEEGLNIYDKLRGNISGLAIPTYILNSPAGYGKISLNKQMLDLSTNKKLKIQTWEGKHIEINLDIM